MAGRSGIKGDVARSPTRRSAFIAGLLVGALLGAAAAILAGPLLDQMRPVALASTPTPPERTLKPVSEPAVQAIPVVAGRPLVIGVLGDSMGDGLWAGLYRQLRDGQGYDVVRLSRAATGLTRYDYVDVQAQTTAQLARRNIDIAVVLVGANDEQGILGSGQAYPFAGPSWRAIYEHRIDALVGLLRQHGAAVYWVGLPKMRKVGYDQKAQLLNSIYEARAHALGVTFVPTVPVTVDESGGYSDYLPDGARLRLMRARDGIHMTMAGYLRLAAPVSNAIRADVIRASHPGRG